MILIVLISIAIIDELVVGAPSGTSEKFVQKMLAVLVEHYKEKGQTLDEDAVLKVVLEGEGKMLDRVDAFHQKIQQDHCGHEDASLNLSSYDEIYFVTHSQGAPVAILLLYRLVASGLIGHPTFSSPLSSSTSTSTSLSTSFKAQRPQKITVLTMAGILHGPFPELGKSLIVQYIEAESSRELFELNETLLYAEVDEMVTEFSSKEPAGEERIESSPLDSPEMGSSSAASLSASASMLSPSPAPQDRVALSLSARVRLALIKLLRLGVRVVAVGSWMDQVVPVSCMA